MTITKVKRTDDEKRKAANAANRRWRLKQRQQPEPIIVVIQNGEIQKKQPGRPIKHFTAQSRGTADRISWVNSKRRKRRRAKEELKKTVEKITEEDTKQISKDNLKNSEGRTTSDRITRVRNNKSERKTEKSTEEEHGHENSVIFEGILDEQDNSDHMSINNDVAEEFESELLRINCKISQPKQLMVETVQKISQDNDKNINIGKIVLPKQMIVENVTNMSQENDKRKVKNIAKKSHYSDRDQNAKFAHRFGLDMAEIELPANRSQRKKISCDYNDNQSDDKLSHSDTFNYVNSDCSGTSTLSSAPRQQQITNHDNLGSIKCTVLTAAKSGDELIKNGVYVPEAANLEANCKCLAINSTSGGNIKTGDVFWNARLHSVTFKKGVLVSGTVHWEDKHGQNGKKMVEIPWGKINLIDNCGKSQRIRKQTNFYIPNKEQDDNFNSVDKETAVWASDMHKIYKWSVGDRDNYGDAFAKLDDKWYVEMIVSCKLAINTTFLILLNKPHICK